MIQVRREQEVLQQGLQILLSNMTPSEVARFWAACQIGSGNYLQIKDELFAGESVASLYDKISEFQTLRRGD